jgi:hypothetical protein
MVVSASALSHGDREIHGSREALCVVARAQVSRIRIPVAALASVSKQRGKVL